MLDGIEITTEGSAIEVKVTGKLTKEFYEEFVPKVDAQIAEHGNLRILFEMHDFHGWTAGAMWEDTKFALHHWLDIERLAIVGETKWQKGMSVFCKPFTRAKIKYFDHTEADAAREWLTS